MKRALLVAGGVLALGLAGLGTAAAAADGVPQGVTVGDLDLSGLSVREAERRLTAYDVPDVVTLVTDEGELRMSSSRAGLRVDEAATAREAASVGPLDRLRALVGASRSLDPVVDVDRDRLEAELRRLAATYDRAPREGVVRFDRDARPVAGVPLAGRTLAVDGAAERIAQDWPAERIDVPAEVEPVKTTREDVQRALEEVARPAVAADVTITVSGKDLVVRPREISAGLSVEVGDSGVLEPQLDGDKVRDAIGDRIKRVEQPPKDATFDVSSGKPVVVPSKDGRTLKGTALRAALLPVLTEPAPRRASATLEVTPARVTTAMAKGLGVKEVVSSFTTNHPCCRPRVQNIHRIADIVDGHVVLPGETFSLNGKVGRRDRARGFVPAPQILRGEFVDDVGGGVSQFATTLFNAVFFAGLKDVEHKPHSYYISRYPPGREATVSFPQPDLKFRNDSPHGILVKTSYTSRSITVTFWGTKRFSSVESVTGERRRIRPFVTKYVDRPDCTATEGEEGFDIVVFRVFKQGGREVRRERFFTRYLPEPNFICGKDPNRRS